MSDTDALEKLKDIFKNGVALKIALHIESNKDTKGGLLDTFADALSGYGIDEDKQEDALNWAAQFLDCVSNGINVQDFVNRSEKLLINVDRKCDNCGCKAVRIVGLMVPHADEDRTYLCDDCWTLSAVLLELED